MAGLSSRLLYYVCVCRGGGEDGERRQGSPETALVPLKYTHVPSLPTRAIAAWPLTDGLGISQPPRGRQQAETPPPPPASPDPGPVTQMRGARGGG